MVDGDVFMFGKLLLFLNSKEGATAAEYAIMVSLIAMAIFVAVESLGNNVIALFQSLITAMTGKW